MIPPQRRRHPKDTYVGGIARPPRVITVGRRRADRWLYRAALALIIMMALFIVYTSLQQHRADEDRARADASREEIIRRLEQQNGDLLCFSRNTQTFEVAILRYLQTQPNLGASNDPAIQDAYRQLAEIEDELHRAQLAQGQPGTVCFGPPATPTPPTTSR